MADAKSKTYYRTSEVEKMLSIPPSTLRVWEKWFSQLSPKRTPGGQRRYCAKDLSVLKHVQYLLHVKGYSVVYARRILNETYRNGQPRRELQCNDVISALRLLKQARGRVYDPHAVARIEAVELFLANIGDSVVFPQCFPEAKFVDGECCNQLIERQ